MNDRRQIITEYDNDGNTVRLVESVTYETWCEHVFVESFFIADKPLYYINEA